MTIPLFPSEELTTLQQALLIWGRIHFRSFPWRETDNPYHILLAEVFLHRTQVYQAERVYHQVIEQYPRPMNLLSAPRQEVLSTWCRKFKKRSTAKCRANVLLNDYLSQFTHYYVLTEGARGRRLIFTTTFSIYNHI